MNLHLDDLAIFVAIADKGSFTGAASYLGIPKSTISRRLSDYEEGLGVTLFNRSTRSISLTEDGAALYKNSKRLIDEALDVSRKVASISEEPAGTIRISATASTSQYLIGPATKSFLALYPATKIEFHLSDKIVDIIDEGLDLAIRYGLLEDSDLVARRFTTVTFLTVASPEYISRVGIPNHPSELAKLDCVALTHKMGTWSFNDDLQVPVRWRLASGSMVLSRQLAIEGAGFAQLPNFVVAEDLRSGRLVQVLSDYPAPPVDGSIVMPRQKYRPKAISKFIDFLVEWHRIQS